MIHILHLLWIVPVSACVGFFACLLCLAASRADEPDEEMSTYNEEEA